MLCYDGSPRIPTLRAACIGVLLLAGSSGCGLHHAYCTNDCGGCSDAVIVDECGGCDDVGCVGGGCGGDLYPGTCGAKSLGHRGGLSGICLPLLSTRLACGSGCGDVYWNEWICDPPECCDPCDDGGCWVGPQRSVHPGGVVRGAVHRVKGAAVRVIHLGLYGYRGEVCGCGGCGGGCSTCDSTVDCGCSACVECGPACVDGCDGTCVSAGVESRAMIAQTASPRGNVAERTTVAHRPSRAIPIRGRIIR